MTVGRILFRGAFARSRRLRSLGKRLDGAFLYLFWQLVKHLPPERARAAGKLLLSWLGPKTHKHVQIIRNLRLAFPQLTEARIDALARAIWGNLGTVLAETPHLNNMSIDGPTPAIHVKIDGAARPIVENRQPAVYVSAHLGNWEAVAFTIAKLGVPLTVVHGPQSNPALETLIQVQRRSLGCRLVAKTHAIRQLVHDIRQGRSVGLLADQRVDAGEAVPFFGVNAPTTTSPAWLALKLDCPLVPVQIERLGNARFRTVFHRPLTVDHGMSEKENILRATAELNSLFEEWIRARPEHWLCIKRRWPVAAYTTSMNPQRT